MMPPDPPLRAIDQPPTTLSALHLIPTEVLRGNIVYVDRVLSRGVSGKDADAWLDCRLAWAAELKRRTADD